MNALQNLDLVSSAIHSLHGMTLFWLYFMR